MRRVALLVALVCVLATIPVGALAATQPTLSGTVTTDAATSVSGGYVLVQNASDGTFAELTRDRSVHETFLKMAQSDIEGVRTAKIDGEGRYAVSVPPGRYDVVAVTRERLSTPVRNVSVSTDATRDLTVERDAVVTVEGGDATIAAGNETTLDVRVHNSDDDPARNVSVAFTVPDGVAVTPGITKNSPSFDADAKRFTWESIPANVTVSFALTVRVPENASQDRYAVTFDGYSETHFVETTDSASVTLASGPTTTVLPGGNAGSATGTHTTSGAGPGLGVLAGAVALVLAILVGRHRS